MASSGSLHSAPTDFFNLPPRARHEVYRLVLALPHPLYLFQDHPSEVALFAPDKPTFWTSILRVNRQMHLEASEVLYSTNCFHLVDATRRQSSLLRAFTASIGPSNANRLTYLCVNFPAAAPEQQHLSLSEDDLSSLTLLRETCASLKTLESHMQRRSTREPDWAREDAAPTIREIAKIYNDELRALPVLEKVIIKVHGAKPAPSIMTSMQNMGWTVVPANSASWS